MAPSNRPRSVISQFLLPLLPAIHALCDLLKKSHRQGMIIGGIISSLLGQPHMTEDIDATVMIDDKDVDQFLIQASAEWLSPRRTDLPLWVYQLHVSHAQRGAMASGARGR